MSVLLLALNEVNFDQVRAYVAKGKLPVLGRLIEQHGVTETTSEANYEELEPWIQWVTAQTGLTLSEHGIFRLGDIVRKDIPQIWEVLEAQGVTVGAVCPMNAKNRCRSPAFFLPDPWTDTKITGSFLMRKFHQAVARSVNENATSRVSSSSAFWLAAGTLAYARMSNYPRYAKLALAAVQRRSWAKAILLDQVLADLFVALVKREGVGFGSLFLNAAAHIQHHYMFNSAVYEGAQSNPEWYISRGDDPVLDVYQIYDGIVGQVTGMFPDARILLATGLHQDPHPETTFYWRLKDHAAFLHSLGVNPQYVQPLMSRDFLAGFDNNESAFAAEQLLAQVRAHDGTPLFEIDNRGEDLFVMFTWPNEIADDFTYEVNGVTRLGLRNEVAFVAIKNGRHNGVGYLVDTGRSGKVGERLPLTGLPSKIAEACGAVWPAASQTDMTPTA
jgi:hypothetical protein